MSLAATTKRALHRILARFWLREGTVRMVPLGPYRGLTFRLSPPMMSRLGIFYRAYEPAVTAWLRASVEPGMTVCVVGGHVGIHVLYIARLLQRQGQVYAFEGWPENHATLTENIALNERLRSAVTILPHCITRFPGTVQMAAGTSDGKHHIVTGENEAVIEVPATSLDAFWRESQACPDVILMDIEGHELDALKGAEAMLATCRPRLILEHHGRAAALVDWLAAGHYRTESLGKRHLVAKL